MGCERQRHAPKKLTKTLVVGTPPPETGRLLIRDTEIKGFGVSITPTGRRTFFLERRLPGRRHPNRITLGHYPDLTVEQARKEAQAHAGKIAKNENPVEERKREEAEAVTLQKAMDGYLRDRTLKPLTEKDCGRVLKRNLKDWLRKPLKGLTPDMVHKRHGRLKERSPAQADLTMRYFRAIYNYARAAYAAPDGSAVLPENPVKRLTGTKAWAKPNRRKTVIKKADLKPWMEAVLALENDVAKDFYLLVLLTGLRKSEALGLTWNDVNFEERTLTIPDPKNSEPHTLPLSDYLVDLLKRRQAAKKKGCSLVFADAQGRPLSNLRYAQKTVTEGSGVTFCVHDLRRTFATIAESLDLSAYTVKKLLNHSVKADVTGGYLVLDTERLRKPMQAITDHILRLGGVKAGAAVVEFPGSVAREGAS